MKRTLALIVLALGAGFTLVGCSSNEENPITPEKMTQIRQSEAAERGNFKPDMTAPQQK